MPEATQNGTSSSEIPVGPCIIITGRHTPTTAGGSHCREKRTPLAPPKRPHPRLRPHHGHLAVKLRPQHFGRVNFLAIFIVIATSLKPAFNVNLLPFQKVIRKVLIAPKNHIRPIGVFFPFADCWSFQRRYVATENRVAAAPDGVNFVSASRPKCPIRITLLTLREAIFNRTVA